MLIAIPWNKNNIHLHFTDMKTEIYEGKWLLVLTSVLVGSVLGHFLLKTENVFLGDEW